MFYELMSKVCLFLSFYFVVSVQRGTHTYILSLPSVSLQLKSQAMMVNCRAFVLMLIEYSMLSFHECLLAQFFMVLYTNVHFFPPHFQITVDTGTEAI